MQRLRLHSGDGSGARRGLAEPAGQGVRPPGDPAVRARLPYHAAGVREATGLGGAEGRGDVGGVAAAVGKDAIVLDRLAGPLAHIGRQGWTASPARVTAPPLQRGGGGRSGTSLRRMAGSSVA